MDAQTFLSRHAALFAFLSLVDEPRTALPPLGPMALLMIAHVPYVTLPDLVQAKDGCSWWRSLCLRSASELGSSATLADDIAAVMPRLNRLEAHLGVQTDTVISRFAPTLQVVDLLGIRVTPKRTPRRVLARTAAPSYEAEAEAATVRSVMLCQRLQHFALANWDGDGSLVEECVAALPNLRVLELARCPMVTNLRIISATPRPIHRLVLSEVGIRAPELNAIVHALPHLATLSIRHAVDMTSLDFLRHHPALTDLSIHTAHWLKDVTDLSTLKSLTRVSLREAAIEDISALSEMPALRAVELNQLSVDQEALRHVVGLRRVRLESLMHIMDFSSFVAALGQTCRIEWLRIGVPELHREFEALSRTLPAMVTAMASSLQHLSLVRFRCMECCQLGAALAAAPVLRTVNVFRCDLGEDGLLGLWTSESLVALGVFHCRGSVTNVTQMIRCGSVRELHVVGMQGLTPHDVAALGRQHPPLRCITTPPPLLDEA